MGAPGHRDKIAAGPATLPPVFEGGVTKLTQLRQEYNRLGFPTSSLDGPDLRYSPSLLTAKSPLQSVTGLEDVMGLFSAMGSRKAGAASEGEGRGRPETADSRAWPRRLCASPATQCSRTW